MDRLYSYNWLKEHTGLKITAEEFAKKFSLHSMTIDRVYRLTPKFSGVITAKILDIKPHPNADKLRLAAIDTGSGQQTVVCGAPNIEVGQVVPLAKEGAVVVDSKNSAGGTFVITRAKIRDVESNGMLCSLKELGMSDDHAGIWVLPSDTPVGQPLDKLMDLPDSQLKIEITSNRPDAMSVVGLAREAAAVFGTLSSSRKRGPLEQSIAASRDSRLRGNDKRSGDDKRIGVTILDKKFCPRYQAIVIDNITVKPSPLWMQLRLLRSGLRPINNIVDITNYVLLEYGQPMHAFDFEKLDGKKIVVRKAKSGEKIEALDGKTYALEPSHGVIADGSKPIAIAGVMGGQHSAVSASTKTIVFECACFDGVSVRKTSRQLNLRSDSSELFEKGLSPEAIPLAIQRAVELTLQTAGGVIAAKPIDVKQSKPRPMTLKLSPETIKRYFGFELPPAKVKSMLAGLGFGVKGNSIQVPWWRQDVEGEHDVIEELARLYGYDTIKKTLPSGQLPSENPDPILTWEGKTKQFFRGLGFTELYTYSFISEKTLKATGYAPDGQIKIANVLNADQVYMRPTLVGSILEAVAENQTRGLPLQLFELTNIYIPTGPKELPDEKPTLVVAIAGTTDEVFLNLKGLVTQLLELYGVPAVTLRPVAGGSVMDNTTSFEIYSNGRHAIGKFGLVSVQAKKSFGVDCSAALLECDIVTLAKLARPSQEYKPVPEFPAIERDLSLVVGHELTWLQLAEVIEGPTPNLEKLEYLSTYSGKGIEPGKKALALRLTFRSGERTLKSEEVDEAVAAIVSRLSQKFGATVR